MRVEDDLLNGVDWLPNGLWRQDAKGDAVAFACDVYQGVSCRSVISVEEEDACRLSISLCASRVKRH